MSNADETPPLEKKQPPSSPWNSPSASPPSSTDTVSYDRHCLLTENADNIRTMFRLERLAALEEDNKRLKAKSKHLEEDNEHLKEDQAKSERLETRRKEDNDHVKEENGRLSAKNERLETSLRNIEEIFLRFNLKVDKKQAETNCLKSQKKEIKRLLAKVAESEEAIKEISAELEGGDQMKAASENKLSLKIQENGREMEELRAEVEEYKADRVIIKGVKKLFGSVGLVIMADSNKMEKEEMPRKETKQAVGSSAGIPKTAVEPVKAYTGVLNKEDHLPPQAPSPSNASPVGGAGTAERYDKIEGGKVSSKCTPPSDTANGQGKTGAGELDSEPNGKSTAAKTVDTPTKSTPDLSDEGSTVKYR